MEKGAKKLVASVLTGCLAFSFVGCGGGKGETKYYNNEEDPLRFTTLEVDKVFNPFFSSSSTDANVIGYTQLSMLTNDAAGKVKYGDDEPVLVKDMESVEEKSGQEVTSTTYYFVLKNNVKFSNNSPVTMKDVLFNMYVYLDMAYSGSATMYSTDIVGLKEYRTQASTETEQDSFMAKFEDAAKARIQTLTNICDELLDEHKYDTDEWGTEEFKGWLKSKQDGGNEAHKNLVDDYTLALKLFGEELEEDYSNSMNSYQDMIFKDENDVEYKGLFTTDVEVFLYNEGEITWSKKDGKLTYPGTDPAKVKAWSKETAINYVRNVWLPEGISDVVTYWNTGNKLVSEIANKELEAASSTMERPYKNISGIKFANGGTERGGAASVTVNGTAYPTPTYNSDGSVASGNEVLSIKINKVDPKAIWNFAFAVAPMYYYSDTAHINAFDYVEHFGVDWNSKSFMDSVVNSPDKIGVPVGAGPYMAAKASGGTDGVSASDFYSHGVIYYERNPYYIGGPAKIKKMRLVVRSSTQMLNSLYADETDFAEPNANPDTEKEIKSHSNLECERVKTSGYGYIGINAGKIAELKVRQAIMYCIDTRHCVNYYDNSASRIYRSMSTASWAYPEGCTPYYPYIGDKVPADLNVVDPQYKAYALKKGKKAGDTFTEAEQKAFIQGLMEDAGYRVGSDGVYYKGSTKCKYDFTIAGESNDHPAWNAMSTAASRLNGYGFDITVRTDANALKKLNTGSLTVWAAAWSSTIDPDMYQVYHKESTATSVKNWGYPQILRNAGNRYDTENEILNRLSKNIMLARETNDQQKRAEHYKDALNNVMELAVELPTYQRDDLFAYNKTKIDKSSLAQDASPYKSLTSDMHLVSLVVRNEEK